MSRENNPLIQTFGYIWGQRLKLSPSDSPLMSYLKDFIVKNSEDIPQVNELVQALVKGKSEPRIALMLVREAGDMYLCNKDYINAVIATRKKSYRLYTSKIKLGLPYWMIDLCFVIHMEARCLSSEFGIKPLGMIETEL